MSFVSGNPLGAIFLRDEELSCQLASVFFHDGPNRVLLIPNPCAQPYLLISCKCASHPHFLIPIRAPSPSNDIASCHDDFNEQSERDRSHRKECLSFPTRHWNFLLCDSSTWVCVLIEMSRLSESGVIS